MELENRGVIVLGGSSGMGLAVAAEAQSRGARVTIAGRDADRLERARQLIGGTVRAVTADVRSEDSVRRLLAEAGETSHVLVTAATLGGAPIVETDAAATREIIDTRLWGAVYVAKHAASRLAPDGSITLMSGISVWKPMVGGALASASAGAVETLTRTLAVELAPLRVNCLQPGVVDTPQTDAFFGDRKDEAVRELAAKLPVGRIGTPQDIAAAALFLMTNGYVTGTVLTIDGGDRLI